MFGIKEGERLKLYKHTNGTCNASALRSGPSAKGREYLRNSSPPSYNWLG